jgi:hypothetical protein
MLVANSLREIAKKSTLSRSEIRLNVIVIQFVQTFGQPGSNYPGLVLPADRLRAAPPVGTNRAP